MNKIYIVIYQLYINNEIIEKQKAFDKKSDFELFIDKLDDLIEKEICIGYIGSEKVGAI